MGVDAVLPPSTSWGFQFHGSNASVNSSCSFDSVNNTTQTPQETNKRKLSSPDSIDEDSESDSDVEKYSRRSISPISSKAPASSNLFMSNLAAAESLNASFQRHYLSPTNPIASSSSTSNTFHRTFNSRIKKRARVQNIASRPLPISRLVETLDKLGLENLISTLCQSHPELTHEIISLTPKITVNSSLDTLKNRLDAVFLGLPYKGDQQGDYAYLRVKPAVNEFLSALADYTAHFLPPNEQQLSNSLAFLDGATSLLHKLPTWNNPMNNHSKNTAYDEISQAWILTLTEASKRSNGLGLAYGGWEQKLAHHNDMSGHSLNAALSFIRQELAWLETSEPSSSPSASSASFSHRLSNSPFSSTAAASSSSPAFAMPIRTWNP